MTKRDEHEVLLRLTPAEALVLFEWLSRVDGGGQLPIEDPAETHVLWRLEGQLESCLSEPLAANYHEAVEAARREVCESNGGSCSSANVAFTTTRRRTCAAW